MSRSGVYLVSARSTYGSNMENESHKNPAYDNQGDSAEYSSVDGVHVKISEKKEMPDRPYRGMGKEELLHFSSQPFWRRLRLFFVAFIILAWVGLIITVLALVLAYPKCRDPGYRAWWQNEAIYRIYVPSFKDSDDNGVGDLAGIESKLDYIQGLGYGVISLSPFYSTEVSTSFKDGDDLALLDHKAVDTNYGTLGDFDSLVMAAHDRGMYVVIDFVPGVTSDQHPWYKDSVNKANERQNFYVWTDSTNNWVSLYDGSAWTNNPTRNQSYLHHFRPETPDLNLRSSLVQEELEAVLNFWLNRSIDGFNIRNAAYLYTDYDLRNQPLVSGASAGSTKYDDYNPIYTRALPEVYSLLERWRDVVLSSNKTNTEKLLVTGLDGGLEASQLYKECVRDGIQVPLNTDFTRKTSTCNGACFNNYVEDWMTQVPTGKWPNWVSGDQYTSRFVARFDKSLIAAFTAATMLLPGTPVAYYGDELYLPNVGGPASAQWTRVGQMRAPMRWDNSTNGGFCNSSCTPWTSPVTDWSVPNAKDGSDLTSVIKELFSLRQEPSFRVGDYFPALRDDAIFSFVREFDGETGYLVAVNFGNVTVSRDFTGSHDTIPAEEAVVALTYGNSYGVEDEVNPDSLELGPYGALVVSWDYVAKEL